MVRDGEAVSITRGMVEALTIDALLLADEADAYFGSDADRAERERLDPRLQVALACEALRTSSLLKQLLDWLAQGSVDERLPPEGLAACDPLPPEVEELPPRARALAHATRALCRRVSELPRLQPGPQPAVSPARLLQSSLAVRLAAR
jgi:regulator of CtrA degradation